MAGTSTPNPTTAAAAEIVDRLLKDAFAHGDPRSPEYHRGARAALERRLMGRQVLNPYAMGNARADAFWAGVDRGNAIWVRHVEGDLTA
ncbi:hypothetical protein Lcho_2269 [Leptothrix cholodnii SP-6]|uniref:Uncharacterized protein n=1 Tax=Leptothrix cholodnii (strain ATCC 51168 / LMG 8142 / SP-6) TaxID=395495 RepID=B1Y413_LEPCP|nr:hypothetical protein [Leptothrix cholodnii]ACB34535.1 hypothetical protein Lcho_2269 [Leptothrix cholodnii SP-6]